MNQLEFLKLFGANTKKIQYSASDDLKAKKGHSDRGFKPNVNKEDIESLNKKGFGVYFTVNRFPKGLRKKDKCLGVRAVFIEDDETGELVTNFPLKPSIIVNSSPGKYHYYWLTSTKKFKEFELVMQTMVDKYNCDNHARDISRVLRLPETFHHKGKKHKVEVVGGTFKKYKWEVITTAFPLAKLKKSNYSKGDGKFNIKEAVKALVSTDDLHGSMISIAMSCASKGMSKDLFNQTMDILHSGIDYDKVDRKRQGDIAARFNDVHLDECYDSAVIKLEEDTTPKAKKPKKSDKSTNCVPKLPKNIMDTWPEPWPLIWKEFKKLPRTLEEELLLPTILSIHSYLLNSNYVTEWGLRPNLAFLGIAMSTANKDVNSKRVIRALDHIFKQNGYKHSPFSNMASNHESVTSDSAFLESFNESENFFWINTEATHIFQQMSQAGVSNSHVKALESKIVDVVDGQEIMGKMKSGKALKTIKDPNCQILLYTQPETISSYLKSNLIDSGLLGRMIITVHKSDSDPFEKTFIRKAHRQFTLDKKLVEFYGSVPGKTDNKKVLMPTDEGLQIFKDWMQKDIKQKAGTDDIRIKMLKRLEITAEQIYTLVLGVSHLYQTVMKVKKPLESFDPTVLLPLFNYWADCKLYAISEYVNTSVDPLADAIVQAAKDLISGDKKVQAGYQKLVNNYHVVPISEITRIIKSQKTLLRNLDSNNDTKNIVERISRIVRILAIQGSLIEIEIPNKRVKYYGFEELSE